MTQEEFIAGYCERSHLTRAEFDRRYIALACACGEEGCQGFAAVNNLPQCIEAHMDLYAPESAG